MANHITIRNEKLFCTHCGEYYTIPFPLAVKDFDKKVKAFETLHKDCEKTWVEPEADFQLSVEQRANWWITHGETGSSSKTMWACFMNQHKYEIRYPHDPDDFSRCYKLLKAIPEWRNSLHKLKRLSIEWSNLVDNWDKLTEMYEQNVNENWKNAEKIGMYEFMKSLTNG